MSNKSIISNKILGDRSVGIILILLFAVSAVVIAVPIANSALIAVPDRNTYAYISVNPPLIGAGQPLLVNLWVYPSPNGPNFEMGSAIVNSSDPTHAYQGLHYNNITCTFTRPDGSKDTFMPLDGSANPLGLIAGMSEEVGTMWFLYYPTQVGKWSLSFSFPGQSYVYLNYSVYYKPSVSQTITFTVQKDVVQIGLPPVSLPTGYWTRPINGELREWSQISGDWIPRFTPGNFNPYTTAPDTAHILWTQETALGGLAGGIYGGYSYAGGGGTPSLIMFGRVFFTIATATGTQTRCVDLRTGEIIWQYLGTISDGQIQSPSSSTTAEFSGSPAPWLWTYSATSGWVRYNAWNFALSTNITTNIPSLGSPVWEDDYVAYALRQGTWNPTTSRRPFNFLIKWNMSKVTGNSWLTGVVWNIYETA